MSRASVPEFLELLNAEQYVDLSKVREFCRHGIPDDIRGEVWMYLLGSLKPDKTTELTAALARQQTYKALPKTNDLVARLATSMARRYHARTFGTRSIEGRVHDATVESQPRPPPTRPPQSQPEEDASRSIAGSRQASPLLGADRNALPLMSPVLLANPHPTVPPPLVEDNSSHFRPASTDPTSPSHHAPSHQPQPAVPPSQPRRLFSQFATNATEQTSSSIYQASNPSTAPPSIHSFTRSIVEVLSIWANQHPDILGDLCQSERERREIVDGWVTTVGPFVGCVQPEHAVYWTWGEWRSKMDAYFASNPLPMRLATFMSLFRSTLPELYDYFETEEVPIIEIASRWLTSLFSQEMCLPDLSRLWDSYFSHPEPFNLHTFVCLSVLTTCNDVLEELDQGEARQMLLHLPRLDIDRILHEASNLRKAHLHAISAFSNPPTSSNATSTSGGGGGIKGGGSGMGAAGATVGLGVNS